MFELLPVAVDPVAPLHHDGLLLVDAHHPSLGAVVAVEEGEGKVGGETPDQGRTVGAITHGQVVGMCQGLPK